MFFSYLSLFINRQKSGDSSLCRTTQTDYFQKFTVYSLHSTLYKLLYTVRNAFLTASQKTRDTWQNFAYSQQRYVTQRKAFTFWQGNAIQNAVAEK